MYLLDYYAFPPHLPNFEYYIRRSMYSDRNNMILLQINGGILFKTLSGFFFSNTYCTEFITDSQRIHVDYTYAPDNSIESVNDPIGKSSNLRS